MNLNSSVRKIKGVGKKTESRFNRLGINTVRDLLFHFPFRWEDYTQIKPIKELKEGERVTIKGQVEIIKNKRSKKKNMIITDAVIADESAQIRVVWFSQPYVKKKLDTGDTVYLSGQVNSDDFGLQLINPKFELESEGEKEYTNRIFPVYHLTEGLSDRKLVSSIEKTIDLADNLKDWVPKEIRDKGNFISLSQAVKLAHFPQKTEDINQAKRRLKFNELFLLQLRGEARKQTIKSEQATEIAFREKETKKFVKSLPFDLTRDQKVATWEILQDLQEKSPMNRLLEGDVGAGKTVVAAIAFYNVILNDFQSAFMAPTEILAKQHFQSLQEYLQKAKIALYTSSHNKVFNIDIQADTKKDKREQVREKIRTGGIDITVGTHALITNKTSFDNLAFVVVDEQHRFGVDQRKSLKEKSGDNSTTPHFLSMTATPIPRSFALSLHGDLDLSLIKEMPPGRKPVKTSIVKERKRPQAYEFVKKQLKKGRQAFVICPLVEESDKMSKKKSVEQEYKFLSKEVFCEFEVSKLHGQMSSDQKNNTMRKFSEGKADLLISTSVVEVGVDIPNANMMLIEDAERFGLAQLHQFRGRVGRSSYQSYCLLFTGADSQKAQERLSFFEKHNDGFEVAEYDLKLRGPGEVFGKKQSGMPEFKMASLNDKKLIRLAQKFVRNIDFNKYPKLKEKLSEWEKDIHLE